MTTNVHIFTPYVMEGKVLKVQQLDNLQQDGETLLPPLYFKNGGEALVYAHDGNSFDIREVDEAEAEGLHVHDASNTPMDIGGVVRGLHAGKRYARKGWNGKGMFIFLVAGSNFKVNREPLLSILGEGEDADYRPHVDMKAADGTIGPWLCSPSDLLANDWEEVKV